MFLRRGGDEAVVELRRHFPANPGLIFEMRNFIRTGCRGVWNKEADLQAISQLELAVSEAASNIILHGFQGQPGEQIELTLNMEQHRAYVTFVYSGCAFTPPAVPQPDFNGLAESGYGLYLIQQSVDKVDFSRDAAGICTIRFIKNRK